MRQELLKNGRHKQLEKDLTLMKYVKIYYFGSKCRS